MAASSEPAGDPTPGRAPGPPTGSLAPPLAGPSGGVLTEPAVEHPDGPDPADRPTRGPSLRPAMVVVALAVVIILGFSLMAVVTNQKTPPPAARPFAARPVSGTGLRAVPGVTLLRPIEVSDEPPGNIVNAVSVPQGARRVGVANNGGGVDQYDQQVRLSVAASQADVLTFYREEMRRLGWDVSYDGPARNQPQTIEVLGQKAGDDGWFWEMGAVVAPSTFTRSGSDVTQVTIRLFQVPDDN